MTRNVPDRRRSERAGRAWRRLAPALLLAIAAAPSPPADPPLFRDVSARSGLDFRFHSGSRGKHDLPEIMGGGVALIDFDGDGLLDVYFCNGGPIGAGKDDPPGRLYRNLGEGQFADATDRADAPGPSYAMGAAVGDFDGDGRDDLFVTGWRDQRLYRNLGNGRFQDVTEPAGLASKLWSTSAAFADLDADGDLDLFVTTYVDFDPNDAPFCASPDGKRDYCGPEEFAAQPDRLYRNNGDGSFTDVSKSGGIEGPDGRGLGVLVADLTGDRRLDVFVANDGSPCRLFENRGGLTFVEVGREGGVAFDAAGGPLAGMGVSAGDLDGDGRIDLVVGNFLGRSTIGFRNLGAGLFLDDSARLGLVATTRPVLGFGLALEDFDGDGDLDLMQANGHVLDRERLGEPFAMPTKLLRNDGGKFVDASRSAGPFFGRSILGRGLAIGDLDRDGRPDAVVASLDSAPGLLLNDGPGRFLAIELVGKGKAGRSPVGARVSATIGRGRVVREVVGGGSYLSASSRTVFIGLGPGTIREVEVRWPSGKVQTFPVEPGRTAVRLSED